MNTQLKPLVGFQKWYATNKEKLAEKRKARYQHDPEYRKNIRDRAQAKREANAVGIKPDGYVFNMAEAANALNVSIWALREWRKKEYFPEPKEYRSRKWFTRRQMVLLGNIRNFLHSKGLRLSRADKAEMEDLIAFVQVNWED